MGCCRSIPVARSIKKRESKQVRTIAQKLVKISVVGTFAAALSLIVGSSIDVEIMELSHSPIICIVNIILANYLNYHG